MVLEVIGFIIIMLLSIWAILSSGIFLYWMNYGIGYTISRVIWALVLITVGILAGYYGFLESPFQLVMEK